MSHGRIRKEQICLNCNARTFGPYCHICGQQNTEPKETVADLLIHFFNDITHFEGKFISSLRFLLFRPGFLTNEYIRGRRASYMNPVRMYVFTSAFFFILFFTVFDSKNMFNINEGKKEDSVHDGQEEMYKEALKKARTNTDTVLVKKLFGTGKADSLIREKTPNNLNFSFAEGSASAYKSVRDYDSVQRSLPSAKKDNWFTKMAVRRSIYVRERYEGNYTTFLKEAFDQFFHSFPKILFVSLPLFAFILFLLYVRHKDWLYVHHVIFTIHYFVFVFLWFLVLLAVKNLDQWIPVLGSSIVSLLWSIYFFGYLYKAMRNVYGQVRGKTFLKYFLLLVSMLFVSLILFILFFSYTVFTI